MGRAKLWKAERRKERFKTPLGEILFELNCEKESEIKSTQVQCEVLTQ